MNSELLSLDTAAKLARYDKAIEFINKIITNGKKALDEEWDEDTKGYILARIFMCQEILKLLEGEDDKKTKDYK